MSSRLSSSFWREKGKRIPLLLCIGILFLSVAWPRAARAHDPYETTTQILVHPDRVEVTMIMARATAEALFGVERVPSSGGPWTGAPPLDVLYALSSRGAELTMNSSRAAQILDGKDEGDFRFDLEFSAPVAESLSVRAAYLEDLEQGYTGVVQVVAAGSGQLIDIKVLHSSDPFFTFAIPSTPASPPTTGNATFHAGSSPQPPARTFSTFLGVGIEHVVFGYDHLLFLLSVLLACTGLRQVLGILTAFTVAHSVTLTLAALHVIPLANDIVEPMIAASIAVAAFGGSRLEQRGFLLPMTFGFGLIHGLGFAAGLESLVDAGNVRLLGLVGFNLGVELGQIALAIVLLPALRLCRRTLKGELALTWLTRSVGVMGAVLFAWRIAAWV